MVPGKHDFTIYRGSTFEVDVSASDKNGPINFTDVYTSAKLDIYKAWLKPNDPIILPTPIFTLSTTNGYIELEGFMVRLRIPALVTAGLGFTQGVYKLALTVDGVDPITDFMLYGLINVSL